MIWDNLVTGHIIEVSRQLVRFLITSGVFWLIMHHRALDVAHVLRRDIRVVND